PITISPNASSDVHKAANHVAATLGRMTGREFAIQEGTEPSGIVIGTLEEFPDESLAETLARFGRVKMVDGLPIAIDTDAEGRVKWQGVEALAVRTQPQSVRLLGQTSKGAVHAASRFLELLGVRRFSPSPVWEVIPKVREIRFDAEEEQAPNYYVRNIWFAF